MATEKFDPIVEGLLERSEMIAEHKMTEDIPLTPEQMQAQQDAYDQLTNPNVEDVDFEVEREAYMARHGASIMAPVMADGFQIGQADMPPHVE